jgi:alpha-methylacyl-CoA racemase
LIRVHAVDHVQTSVLDGIRIVEFAAQGPGPFCAMMLADFGAEVIRIDRKHGIKTLNSGYDPIRRKRKRLVLDLKQAEGRKIALELISRSDALIEGHRPGVMERLGLGPDVCLGANPRLVYGRVTGWGQDGPLADLPGRDINYIALSGALGAIGDEQPLPPLNLVGDYGGGGMLLAVGLLAALLQTQRSGQGQVVDAAMIDGAALMLTNIFGLLANEQWRDRRNANLLDGGAPFYGTYQCADDRWVAVGALDARSLNALFVLLEIDDLPPREAWQREIWQSLKARFKQAFRARTRDAWCQQACAAEACVSPVLSLEEALAHPHNRTRKMFSDLNGHPYPTPAPRFSSSLEIPLPTAKTTSAKDSDLLVELLGYTAAEIEQLKLIGVTE